MMIRLRSGSEAGCGRARIPEKEALVNDKPNNQDDSGGEKVKDTAIGPLQFNIGAIKKKYSIFRARPKAVILLYYKPSIGYSADINKIY